MYRSWASTFEMLVLLRELGLDPSAPQTRSAIDLVREKVDWGPERGCPGERRRTIRR